MILTGCWAAVIGMEERETDLIEVNLQTSWQLLLKTKSFPIRKWILGVFSAVQLWDVTHALELMYLGSLYTHPLEPITDHHSG